MSPVTEECKTGDLLHDDIVQAAVQAERERIAQAIFTEPHGLQPGMIGRAVAAAIARGTEAGR